MNKAVAPKENKNSFSYGLKQQILKAWQPVPTLSSTICLFAFLSIFFLSIGIALISLTDQITEITQRYDNQCTTIGSICNVTITVSSEISGTVFVYYQLENFYQNHRRYMKSRDPNQLLGNIMSVSDISSTCDPILRNSDVPANMSFGGIYNLSADDPANPCGLIARSFFNGSKILIQETGIAWPSDIANKFKSPPNASAIQWVDSTNATPNFRKLWGSISGGLSADVYYFSINNRTKSIVLSNANAFGGKNKFLSIAYLVVGSFCGLMAMIFLVQHIIAPNRFDKFKKK